MKQHLYVLAVLTLSIGIMSNISFQDPNQVFKYQIQQEKSLISWKGFKVFQDEGHNGTIGIKYGAIEVKNEKITVGKLIIAMDSIKVLDITEAQGSHLLIFDREII